MNADRNVLCIPAFMTITDLAAGHGAFVGEF